MPWMCAFSCDSSIHEPACMRNRISCKQRVSFQCVRVCDNSGCLSFGQRNCISCKQWVSCQCGKVWDISDHLNSCKKNCTEYMQRVFHQNAAAYVSWEFQHSSIKGRTCHSSNGFPLNELTGALWGHPFLHRKRCTGCGEIVFLLNECVIFPLYPHSNYSLLHQCSDTKFTLYSAPHPPHPSHYIISIPSNYRRQIDGVILCSFQQCL